VVRDHGDVSGGGLVELVSRADSLAEYAELVALRIRQHHERVGVGLADVDMSRAERDEAFDFGVHIAIGSQVGVVAILVELGMWRPTVRPAVGD
jgi:hypothetical protein